MKPENRRSNGLSEAGADTGKDAVAWPASEALLRFAPPPVDVERADGIPHVQHNVAQCYADSDAQIG